MGWIHGVNVALDGWIEERARQQREKAKREAIKVGVTLITFATIAAAALIWFYKHG